jgi:hypothetical protein
LPFECEIYKIFQVENYSKAEKELHLLFKDKNIKGEWFNLEIEDIENAINILCENFDGVERDTNF